MKLPILRRGSAANVVAVLALVVAVSSTSAYAATLITSKQIKNGTIKPVDLHSSAITSPKLATAAVTEPKVAANAITGAKVKNGSLSAADLAPGTIPGVRALFTYRQLGVTVTAGADVVSVPIDKVGLYYGTANATIANNGADAVTVDCFLNGKGTYAQRTVTVPPLGEGGLTSVAIALVDNVYTPSSFTLYCRRDSGTGGVSVSQTSLTVFPLTSADFPVRALNGIKASKADSLTVEE